jgi:hypothetical protein
MQTQAAHGEGVEWLADEGRRPARDDRGWVFLHAADEACDGSNPMTGQPCRLKYHQGYHRDASGAEWLDDK